MNRTELARKKALKARQARQARRATPSTVATNPALRVQTTFRPSGAGIRRHKARMTGAQRNGEGRRSEWSMSPYYWTNPTWAP